MFCKLWRVLKKTMLNVATKSALEQNTEFVSDR